MTRVPRNDEGLTLFEWLRAAGWGDYGVVNIIAKDKGATFEQLASAWSNNQDPAEWLSTAPKRYVSYGEAATRSKD